MPISFGDTAINDYEIVRLLLSVGDPEESHEANHFISNAWIRRFYSTSKVHVSQPYSTTGTTRDLWSLNLVSQILRCCVTLRRKSAAQQPSLERYLKDCVSMYWAWVTTTSQM